jgi:hypothetical protein
MSGASFFEEVSRITTPGYIPTEADVLRARTKTTGIYETRFSMGQLSIQCVFDSKGEGWLMRAACLMLAVNDPNARNGYTASKMLPQSSSAWRSASTTKCFWKKTPKYVSPVLPRGMPANKMLTYLQSESDDGESGPVR